MTLELEFLANNAFFFTIIIFHQSYEPETIFLRIINSTLNSFKQALPSSIRKVKNLFLNIHNIQGLKLLTKSLERVTVGSPEVAVTFEASVIATGDVMENVWT